MKIKTLKVKNFRGYKGEVQIDFDNLTAFVGRNDIGKSTLMEALDIFFHDGKGLIKLEKEDINKAEKENGNTDVVISVSFEELPDKVIIDESNETTLANEYLLNAKGQLEVIKCFKNAATTATGIKISIRANHPTNPACSNLLWKKQQNLCEIVDSLGISCADKRKNALMRASIWAKYKDEGTLQLKETEIDVNNKDGDIKAIWGKLQSYMPYFSLFQSDRKNCDGDSEVQDPLKEAVKQIIADGELQEKLDYVAKKVREKLEEVAKLTLSKVKEMNKEIADSLHPKMPTANELKWTDVFKGLSITGDEDIPINKRGSGVRRLILLNFFRAEAERRQKEFNNQHIIYAIEEPETSQHKLHQRMLIKALKELANEGNAQVLITTHSSDIVKQLKFEQLKLVYEADGTKQIKNVEKSSLPYPSLNEVNYLAFGNVNEEYHNELYGFLQSKAIDEDARNEKEKDFENWLVARGCSQSKQWVRVRGGSPQSPVPCTLCTYIRNLIHHPENDHNNDYTEEELMNSICTMKKIVQDIS